MPTSTFGLNRKASVSLCALLNRSRQSLRPTMAARAVSFAPARDDQVQGGDRTAVIVEASDESAVRQVVGSGGEVTALAGPFLSVQASLAALQALIDEPRVRRVQTKKESQLHLTQALPDIGLVAPTGGRRPVAEDGTGVLIGIVDSGFDLSHPMFRDGSGKLRVEGLLDQTAPAGQQEFDNATLESRWAGGRGPGADENGHGTHVASIAAGSRFREFEGVAPGARFLLVKTDFRNTDRAVSWIFNEAAGKPCVVNMSLGHHFGAHDGTDAEEQLHRDLTGPGKILVISAGNERNDDIHIGGRFHAGQTQEVSFDLLRQRGGGAFVILTLWHSRDDQFDVSLITPGGDLFVEPALGQGEQHTFSSTAIELSQGEYAPSRLIQHQIVIEVRGLPSNRELTDWRVRLTCRTATVGRLDGWFHNSGFATFDAHPLVEQARTVGLAATGAACLAVASHVTRVQFESDQGQMTDTRSVLGRTSSFSSLGPTRDGRQKPDVSAPGQWVTAALARESEMSADDRFALTEKQLLTISGTSMAAPVVTGAVALLLQQKPTRTPDQVREILKNAARHDAHTGPGPWDPTYGFGKLDVVKALQAE